MKKLAASPADISEHQGDEPYRRALVACYARMAATRERLLGHGPTRPPRYQAAAYATPEDFAADLDIIAASLKENGDADLAEGRLQNLREAVAAFGFHLATMDVRQNSDVHERAVAELLRVAGVDERLSEAGRSGAQHIAAGRTFACPAAALALCALFRRNGARIGDRRSRLRPQDRASAPAPWPIT